MDHFNDTTQIRAEVILRQLYPHLADQWIAETRGTFYRNYSSDVLHIDPKRATVALSRNSLSDLLPSGLFTPQDEYDGRHFKNKNKEINQRTEVINEFFRPFDTYWFRKSLQIEEQLAAVLEQKIDFILTKYYGCNRQTETNPYIRQLMPLLPHVAQLRGDFGKIRYLLSALFAKQVDLTLTPIDTGIAGIEPQTLVVYCIYVDKMDSGAYQQLYAHVVSLQAFLEEWFIPASMPCKLVLRSHHPSTLNNNVLLNYNARI